MIQYFNFYFHKCPIEDAVSGTLLSHEIAPYIYKKNGVNFLERYSTHRVCMGAYFSLTIFPLTISIYINTISLYASLIPLFV